MSDGERPTVEDAPEWTCSNGHVVPGTQDFCGNCGAARSPKTEAKRSPPPWALVGGVVVAALVVLGVVFAVRGGPGGDNGEPEERTVVRGSLTIIKGGGFVERDPCYGISGGGDYGIFETEPFDYSEYEGGAPVRVLGADGTVLGSSSLSAGEYVTDQPSRSSEGCRFEFEVPLDAESTRYQLVVASSPPYDFTNASEALVLAIGD